MNKNCKKKLLPFICMTIVLMTVLSGCKGSTAEEKAGSQQNSGKQEKEAAVPSDMTGDVVKIGSAEELEEFRERVNGGETEINGLLTADIDLSSICGEEKGNWQPIEYFNGIFDGNEHTVQGLYIVDTETEEADMGGLFLYLQEDSIIRNVTVEDACLEVVNHAGVITNTSKGRIENCHGSGTVKGLQVGGIAGDGEKFTDCSFSGTVEGRSDAGGIAAIATRAEQCRNEAMVISMDEDSDNSVGGIAAFLSEASGCENVGTIVSYNYAGGIAGTFNKSGVIEDCYNEGDVVSLAYAGGIAGFCEEKTRINRCYSTASVTTGGMAGGIAGRSQGEILNCFQSGTVTTDCETAAALLRDMGQEDFKVPTYTTVIAGGITAMGTEVLNCYTTGSVSVTTENKTNRAAGIATSTEVVKNCYSTASLSGSLTEGIGKTSTEKENCFFSENTAQYISWKNTSTWEESTPTAAAAFTDGTVLNALNEGAESLGDDYSAWKQGTDSPCFEWE